MQSAAESQALDSLYFRWKAFRTAGRDVAPAVLCRERPDLAGALAARIAVEHPEKESDADRTGGYTPSPVSGEEAPVETPTTGRYHIMREHAKGGMGRVCEAVDTELNRRVAFKEIQLKYADDANSRCRFVREALITGQLDHPGVIPVYGLGTDAEGRPYYAMRFVEGNSLKAAIKDFHAEPAKRIPVGAKAVAFRGLLKRFVDICNAVAFAHSRNFVHRDLKPANVMLGPFGETLVVDWGLARSYQDKSADADVGPNIPSAASAEDEDLAEATVATDSGIATLTGQLMGTPAYMSPEQSAGELSTLGPAWDIYSLGATLYEILTGKAPFTGKPVGELIIAIQAGTYPAPRSVAMWVPKPLEAVVRKAMALDRKDRYRTAQDMAGEIDRYLADEPVQAYRETANERIRRWARRNRGWVRAATVAGLVSVLVLAASLIVVNLAREDALEAERLKQRALESEKKSHSQTRTDKERVTVANAKARAALDTATDEVLGRLLGKQQTLGPDERDFLRKLIATYTDLSKTENATDEDRAMAGTARLRIGDVYRRLGEIGLASENYKLSIDILTAIDKSVLPLTRSDLASAKIGYARTGILADPVGAVRAMREALLEREKDIQEHPTDVKRLEDFASTLLDAAELTLTNASAKEAEQRYGSLAARFVPLLQADPTGTSAKIRESLADGFDQWALLNERKNPPDLEAAYKYYANAIFIFDDLEKQFPQEPRYRAKRLYSLSNKALNLDQHKKLGEAITDLEKAVAGQRDLTEEFPSIRDYRQALVISLVRLQSLLDIRPERDTARSIVLIEESCREMAQLEKRYPDITLYLDHLIELKSKLRSLYRADSNEAAAEKTSEEMKLLKERRKPKK